MAMSAEEEIQAMAQHYLVCGTEDCKRNCQFYCNPCHQRLCKRCRDEHQKSQDTKDHEVVPYKQRKPQLPEEKCNLHPKRNVEILCKECNVPLCAKCIFMKEHTGHQLDDLEEKYAEKVAFCRSEISKIQEYYLSTSQGLKKEIKEDVMAIKNTMDDIRSSIRAEAESLKELVNRVTSDKLEQANIMEESLLKTLKSQEKTYEDYTEYLEKLLKEFHSYKSIDNIRVLFSDDFKNLKIQSIPETAQPVLPVFTAGHFDKDEVSKLLGSVNFPNTKLNNRRIKPMENASTQLKLTGKQMRRDAEKSDVKQTLSLSSSVTKVREYTVPGVEDVNHISLGKSGRLWGSDDKGNLVQTDLQGDQLQKIQTSGRDEGYHTVTQDGDLIYTDRKNKVINRIKQDNTIIEFIKTGDWEPLCIHSSQINGDILVGMEKGVKAKVTRYNKTRKEIQNIPSDNKGQEIYSYPHYITENINGDICTSDYNKEAVVVVNKSGQHRFSYTGHGSEFYPFGICNDLLGHIIVCNGYLGNCSLDIIDQDGQFLSLLRTQQKGIQPYGLCVDDESHLHVGQWNTNTVTVFKYLQ
nr:protein PML-like [Crassostrea gigas]XP_034314526.1 protein PML-like [Crassostrea gigas]XP_034314527.1 protein PML-like [Crassostrea gigas]XP_034314529.1 protein PML-like [Crassostrea gigas]